MAVTTFMKNNRYAFTRAEAFKMGNVTTLIHDYEVWLKVDMKQRVAGIQVDHKWKWYKIGDLYSFGVTERLTTNSYRYQRVHLSPGTKFFDDSIDLTLGGTRQTLGA